MNKHIVLSIICILLLSGIGANATTITNEQNTIDTTISQTFSQPIITEIDGYLTIELMEANTWTNTPGNPLIPAYRQTLIFPFGTKINDVHLTLSEPISYRLPKIIQPIQPPQPLNSPRISENELTINTEVYESNLLFPTLDMTYSTGAGLQGKEHKIFLTITCYPVHYRPQQNILYVSEHIDISIDYEHPAEPILFSDDYDLLIIAPQKFESKITPLVEHKNSIGTSAIFKSTEQIYDEFPGRDKCEQIKYCIKDMLDTKGIHYVLLIGGLDSYIYAVPRDNKNEGDKDWHLPVRYTNLYDGGTTQDPGYISDLYFGDIYDGEGNFSSWDSNENDIFAEWWLASEKDILDLYPDVYVGRLACRNSWEVKTCVKKIIAYESTPADSSWFNKMVVVGSDTFDDVAGTNYYEGEVETQKSLDYMTDFEPIKIWGSNRNTTDLVPEPLDIIKTVSKGCGFLAFAGHGSPERWNSYWPEGFHEERLKGLWWWNMPFFFNGNKLPVCVVGGCHNSQFNVTSTGFLLDQLWVYGPVPECWSWMLARKAGGGSIATIGNSGLGYGKLGNNGDLDGDGIDEPDCVEALGGYIETQFFKAYGVDNYTVLGETWGMAINAYLTTYPPMLNKLDCKTVEQWVLLGDPSLQIGGIDL